VARPYEITDARALGGGVYLLSLKGLADRDAADALRGQAVWARRADLPPLGEEEFYVTDLIGCAVHDQAGAQVGTVADIEHIAGRDLLVLSRPGGGEALVPLLPEFVTSVDLPARRVEIDAPEGLLDLAQAETA
jgi:16S rRNA processing protein RimM